MSERIETLNQRLIDHYGKQVDDNSPNYRIVWSDDQLEKRLTDYDSHGFQLLVPEVRELPKYSYIKERWLLEKLLIVPLPNIGELTTQKSYECVWNFEDINGNFIYPKWEACKLVIDTIHKHMNAITGEPYKDEHAAMLADPKIAKEVKEKEVDDLVRSLYGNDTDVTDRLANKEGIVVPSNYGVH